MSIARAINSPFGQRVPTQRPVYEQGLRLAYSVTTLGLGDGSRAPHPMNDIKYIFSHQRVMEIAELARRQGWELIPLLKQAGVLQHSRQHRCVGVTKESLTRVVHEMWTLTDDELMGLGSQPVPRGTFRLLAYALNSASTLFEALQRLEQCRTAVPGLPYLTVVKANGVATVTLDVTNCRCQDAVFAESLLTIAHRVMGWAVGRTVPLIGVQLPRPRPQSAAEYEFMFGTDIDFSATDFALVLESRALEEPLCRSSEELDELLNTAPYGLLTDFMPDQSHTERIRQIMKSRVGWQWGTADDIAAQVGMSRQTLHRKLRAENTSIIDLKNEVLCGAAVESLMKGEETVTALSHRLGFSEPAAFTRAFRRWTGVPPSAYRATVGLRDAAGE